MDYFVTVMDNYSGEELSFHLVSFYLPYTEDFILDIDEYCLSHDISDWTFLDCFEGF